MIKNYSVTLDEEVVARAKKIYIRDGGKLSPLINRLLKIWIRKKEGDNGNIK